MKETRATLVKIYTNLGSILFGTLVVGYFVRDAEITTLGFSIGSLGAFSAFLIAYRLSK